MALLPVARRTAMMEGRLLESAVNDNVSSSIKPLRTQANLSPQLVYYNLKNHEDNVLCNAQD